MIMITHLKPTELYAVEVPEDAHSFKISTDTENDDKYSALYYEYGVEENYLMHLNGHYEIIGTTTANDIEFDCYPYLRNTPSWIEWYNDDYDYKDFSLSDSEAFLSLMQSNGLDTNKKHLILKKL